MQRLLESCGVLLNLAEDVASILGIRLASMVLFGSAVEEGCKKRDRGDIDVLLLLYDVPGADPHDDVVRIIKKYEEAGYMISLNYVYLSDFMKKLAEGNSMAIKIIVTGYPIIGRELFYSLRRFLEISPLVLGKEAIFKNIISLYENAKALLNTCRRDLFTVCGMLKTAVGYVLVIKSGHYDPDKSAETIGGEVGQLYGMLKSYCRQALRGEISPAQLEAVIQKIEKIINEICAEDHGLCS